jgi:hypothetical protein
VDRIVTPVERKMIRNIFMAEIYKMNGKFNVLNAEELLHLYRTPGIIRIFISRRL